MEKCKDNKNRKRRSSCLSVPKPLPVRYDYEKIGTVNFPSRLSVPYHLLEEFGDMFTNNTRQRKGKIHLKPAQPLDSRAREFLAWSRPSWNAERLNVVSETVLKRSGFTFSHIDWLCVNYSATYDIHYPLNNQEGIPTEFYINEEYNKNLDVFCRLYFDAFSRNQRILVEYQDTTGKISPKDPSSTDIEWDSMQEVGVRNVGGRTMVYLITAVAQLLFFQWAIDNKVVEYCRTHAVEIDRDMKATKDPGVTAKTKRGSRRRRRLSKPAPKTWRISRVSVTLRYDRFNYNPKSTVMGEESEKIEQIK